MNTKNKSIFNLRVFNSQNPNPDNYTPNLEDPYEPDWDLRLDCPIEQLPKPLSPKESVDQFIQCVDRAEQMEKQGDKVSRGLYLGRAFTTLIGLDDFSEIEGHQAVKVIRGLERFAGTKLPVPISRRLGQVREAAVQRYADVLLVPSKDSFTYL